MSNGKFFSGLPDSMLRGSSNRPDRMESHLFWPDEMKSDGVDGNNSTKSTPSKRATRPAVADDEVQYNRGEFIEQNQPDTPKAKELYSQHQTSKIQFNEYGDDRRDYGGSSGNNSGARNNQNNQSSAAQTKNTNITNNYNNRMGFSDNSAKLNALKSNIGFYDYPDESRNTKAPSTARSSNRQNETTQQQNKQQQESYDRREDEKNNSISKSRSDDNVLKCKMNNDLYELDRKLNNLNVNKQNYNSNSNDYNNSSVNKSSRIIEVTNSGNGGAYDIPIKVRNETTHSSHIAYSNTTQQRDHSNSQQYQNTHNVPISLDREYVSSRGCPQKSYNNITPLYSQQEQSPVIHAKSRAHDHLKSNIFFHNTSNNTSPPATTTRQHRPLSVRDSAVCRVGVGLPDM